jgi:hypothetical protein
MRTLLNSVAFVFVLGAAYCFLWVLSSSDLACTACNCTFSLFSENARCRQPPVAGLLCIGSVLIAVGLVLIGRRYRSPRGAQSK